MRYCYIFALLLLFSNAFSQDDCCTAFPLQDNSPVLIPSSAGSGMFENLNACSCLAGNEHDSYWFAFECTSSGTFEMMITPTNLSADFDFALYGNECPCGGGTTVASCNYTGPITPPGPFVPTGISSTPMATFGVPGATEFEPTVSITAGTIYYIVADNITSNGAGFTIEFGGTAVIGPIPSGPGNPAGPSPVTGDLSICPGVSGSYNANEIPGFSGYNWTVNPPIATINNNGSANITVDWTVETTYELCVSATGGCETTDPTCVTVNVQSIAPIFVEDEICIGDTYTFPGNGQSFFSPGVFNIDLTTPSGCDSMIILSLTPLAPSLSFENTELCPGDCIDFNGQQICSPGTYDAVLTNYVGCDSTASIIVIEVVMEPIITPDPPDMIDCVNSSVFLDASGSLSFTNIDNYSWFDENGNLVGSGVIFETFSGGDYTLIIEDEAGCMDQTTVTVIEDPTEPEAFADADLIDCNNPVAILNGSSTANNPTYEWSGPNNFSSFEQFPTTTDPGIYNLIITAPNGCTAEAMVEVTADNQMPDITADGGNIDCITSNINLTGNSTTSGVTYEWNGPNGFIDFSQNPLVSEAGTYVLLVTAPNGCTAEAAAIVIGDLDDPDISANGNTLDCTAPFADLVGNSTTPNVTYEWTGPNNFFSQNAVTPATEAGIYTLVVTAANGCTAEITAEITGNMDAPDASAMGGSVDCIATTISINGNSITPDVTYSWTGPNGFESAEQNPLVTDSGDYTLIVTSANGCSAAANAMVLDNSDNPDISTTGGTLTCTTPNIAIGGNSTTPDVTYSWTGPNGFESDQPNPMVSEMGDYTLVITAPNGCTNSELVSIPSDQDMPDISIVGGTLDCNNQMISLSGSSTTAGVTYSWTGPNGFESAEQNSEIIEGGDYILTVIAPNGCDDSQMVNVATDFEEPDIQTIGATIDCNNPNVEISGSSIATGAVYAWTGPNSFTSDLPNPIVSLDGNYSLIITAANGCTSTADALVDTDLDEPEIAVIGGIITCADPQLTISGNTTTPDVTYAWEGPNNFVSDDPNPVVTEEGDYILTITGMNGCTAFATAEVTQDADIPEVSLEGGTLTCADTDIQINTNSSNLDVTYAWNGPNGFESDEQNPIAVEPGIYEVLVTAMNGCSEMQQVEIFEDILEPDATADGGTITCTESMISISGGTSNANATISWSGPGGFTSDDNQPVVSEIGDYIFTVTGINGCTTTAIATVEADADLPEVGVTGGTLNCDIPEIQLSSNSSNPNVTYSWTGPNGFVSDEPNPLATEQGSYILIVTTPTDCSATATAVVEEDIAEPDVVLENGLIDCNDQMATLTTTVNSNVVEYAWTGPNSFVSDEPNPLVAEGGIYELLTIGANGCTNLQQLEIIEDTQEPDIAATAQVLNCDNPMTLLEGISTTQNATYQWTGPNNFNSDELQPEITAGGDYTLLITGPNGCISSMDLMVEEDFVEPDITTENGLIDCGMPNLNLVANSMTDNLTYNWTSANGFESMEATPQVAENGDYVLIVTAENGCTNSVTAVIEGDFEQPEIQAIGGTLTCTDEEIAILGSSTTPDVTYAWEGPNSFTSDEAEPIINEAGDYTLIITGSNSCTNEMVVEVLDDTDEPNISANGGTLTCDIDAIMIIGNSTTQDVTYSWETPAGQTLAVQNPEVDLIGDYILTITAQNGCTSTQTINVAQDTDAPDIEAIGGLIDCNNTEITLEGNSNTAGVEYSWEAPNGMIINEQNSTVDEGGNYILTITATNGCMASMAVMVEADFAEPDISSTGATITCDEPIVQVSGNSMTQNVTYLWVGPNGFLSEVQNPTTNEAGNYALIITGENGCTSTEQVLVALDADVPVASAEGGTLTCQTEEIILEGGASVGNVNYSWEGPNGFSSDDQNPTVDLAGNYILTITAANGCSNSITAIVGESFDLPVIDFETPDEFLCDTEEVVIDASGSDSGAGFTINWTTTNGNISNGNSTLTPTIVTAGTYIIEIINENNGCISTADVAVLESDNLPTDAVLFLEDPSCFGENDGVIAVESVIGGQPPYQYSLNGSDFASSPQFAFLEGGSYDLAVIDAGGCEYSTQILLTEPQELMVDLLIEGEENRLNLGETFQLNAQVNIPNSLIDSIIWSPENSIPVDCQGCFDPEIAAIFTASYDVTVIDENGCIASDFIDIIVNQERPVYVPNIFSPNGDGFNDELYIFGGPSVANVKSFNIFNRWGEVVFSYYNFPPNNFGFGWDGTQRGEKLKPDVFIYMAEIEFIDGKTEIFKGDIMLAK